MLWVAPFEAAPEFGGGGFGEDGGHHRLSSSNMGEDGEGVVADLAHVIHESMKPLNGKDLLAFPLGTTTTTGFTIPSLRTGRIDGQWKASDEARRLASGLFPTLALRICLRDI